MTVAEHKPTKDNKQYEFDVALSFAEEDRAFVDKVARHLKRKKVKIFYDKDAMIDTWGKNMYVHLDEIYKNKARYCVMFISKHYKVKRWTQHEAGAVQARAFLLEHGEYILPFRFDDTEIDGIRDTIGYLPINDFDEKQLAVAIIAKLDLSKNAPVPQPFYRGKKIGLSPLEKAGRMLRSRIKLFLLTTATVVTVVLGINKGFIPADNRQDTEQQDGGAAVVEEPINNTTFKDAVPQGIRAIKSEVSKTNVADKKEKQGSKWVPVHAVCRDGSLSTSRGPGTCSGHGGVASYIDTLIEATNPRLIKSKR